MWSATTASLQNDHNNMVVVLHNRIPIRSLDKSPFLWSIIIGIQAMMKKTFLLIAGMLLFSCASQAPLVHPNELDEELEVKNSPAPDYPDEAREKGHEGAVIVEAVVDVDGTVESAEVTQSSGYRELDKAAKDAAKQWVFSEPVKDGQPVRTVVVITFKFELS
jgi:TonB family protein